MPDLLVAFHIPPPPIAIHMTSCSTSHRKLQLESPLTSQFRLVECIALKKHGISPYEGDTCHHVCVYYWQKLTSIIDMA